MARPDFEILVVPRGGGDGGGGGGARIVAVLAGDGLAGSSSPIGSGEDDSHLCAKSPDWHDKVGWAAAGTRYGNPVSKSTTKVPSPEAGVMVVIARQN